VLRNGLLLVDKPTGMTSHDVVGHVRRALKTREVGHAGTLDPLASGLMVLLLGEGTKLSDYILSGDKTYELKVKLGVVTDSLDLTGQVLQLKDVKLEPQQIVNAANELQGEFQWPVPLFSAAKVDGKKLYQYAHQGQADRAPELPLKTMSFWGLQILEVGPDYLKAQLSCSKGSFIRTWASQLGEKLGVGGAIETLRRVQSQPYHIRDATTLEQIERGDSAHLSWVQMGQCLPGWKTITVRGKDETLLYNGQISHELERRLIHERREAISLQKPVGIKVVSPEGTLISIIEAQPAKGLKIKRVFKGLVG
jgi:tRNA pseudouridine55 synthase